MQPRNLDWTTQLLWHGAARLATTVFPYQEPYNRLFLIATTIAELSEPTQNEMMKYHSTGCACGICICPMHATHPWGLLCSRNINTASPFRSKAVPYPACVHLPQNLSSGGVKARSIVAGKFDVPHNTLGTIWLIRCGNIWYFNGDSWKVWCTA